MTFIISEDEALHDLLKGMTVSDKSRSDRPVGVWFGQPDLEVREQAFPYVTISLVDVSEATERVMNAEGVEPWYYAPTMDAVVPAGRDGWVMPYPVPVNLDYQVTTFARDPRHDRQILGQIVGNRLPLRFGSLTVREFSTGSGSSEVAQCTVRRLDMLNIGRRDATENNKRMFLNYFTIRVSSETPVAMLANYYTRVQQVDIAAGGSVYPRTLSDPSLTTTASISVPAGTP